MAYDAGELEIGSPITLRLQDLVPPVGFELPEGVEPGEDGRVVELTLTTTLGRAIFNRTLPMDYPFVDAPVDKKRLSTIVNDLAERYSNCLLYTSRCV